MLPYRKANITELLRADNRLKINDLVKLFFDDFIVNKRISAVFLSRISNYLCKQ